MNSKKSIRLVKGSHIITKKLYDKDIAFTLQNSDNRVIFVIPYNVNYSLIGTTEIEVTSPENTKIDKNEIDYLLNVVNKYFINQISINDIVDTYSGIRPLIEDYKIANQVSRDYYFDLNVESNFSPLLNVYGGKLTTFRKLSENVLKILRPYLSLKKIESWTHNKKL